MSALSSVVTIAAPTAGVARLHKVPSLTLVGTLLPAPANPKSCSISFAADIDGAEKGKPALQSEPISMRRSAAAKVDLRPPVQPPNPVERTEPEEGSSTGASLHPENDKVTEELVKKPWDLESKCRERTTHV
jgi:hypothetical protein